jgi:hypothetical protein
MLLERLAARPLASFTAVALATVSFACSGQLDLGNHPDGGSSGGGSSSGGVALGDGGSCSGTPTDLHGTWDLIGAAPGGTPATGVLVLGDNSFSIAFGSTSLTFTGPSNPVVWTDSYHGSVTIHATQVGSAVDTGLLPLNLGGGWTFTTGTSPGCNASLSTGTFNATCTDGYFDLPEPLPSNLTGTMNATKTSSLPSIFGALGGVWTAAFVDGTCTATISGNTVYIGCNESALSGSVQVSICQGIVSGSTSSGVAFTGRQQ